MNKIKFWQLMEEIRINYDDENDDPIAFGQRLFTDYSDVERAIFNGYLDAYLEKLEDYPYAAMSCYIINGYISDATFFYFNLWLISQGEEVVKNVLRNPDRLADLKDIPWGSAEFEDLLSIQPVSDHPLMIQQNEEIERTVDELSFYMTTSLDAYKDTDEVLADSFRRLPDLVKLSGITIVTQTDEEDEQIILNRRKEHFVFLKNAYSLIKMLSMSRKYKKKNTVLDREKAQYLAFGGIYLPVDIIRCLAPLTSNKKDVIQGLIEWWGVYERPDIIEMIDTLAVGKHHTLSYKMKDFDVHHPAVEKVITQINKELEVDLLSFKDFERCQTVLAWDLERGANLARTGVSINYLSEKEAYEYLQTIAETAQGTFKNWQEYLVSFIAGRMIWGRYEDDGFFSSFAYSIRKYFFDPDGKEEQQPIYLEFPLATIGKNKEKELEFADYGLPLPEKTSPELLISNKEKLLQTHSIPNKDQIKELDFWKDRGISPIHKAFFSSFIFGTVRAFQKSVWFGLGALLVTLIYGMFLLSRDGKPTIFKEHSLVPAILCGKEQSELFTLMPVKLRSEEHIFWLARRVAFPKKDFSRYSSGELIPCVLDQNDGEELEQVLKKTEIHPLHYGYTKESVIDYAKSVLSSHPVYPKEITSFLNRLVENCPSTDVVYLDQNFQ